ncbi:MAG TPA: hypothetical protein VFQ43_21905, partial [Nitrososphaera sp.]|nr:hypothetical protein [Nitrososphaera sp.]
TLDVTCRHNLHAIFPDRIIGLVAYRTLSSCAANNSRSKVVATTRNASPHIYLHGRWGQYLTDLRRGSNQSTRPRHPVVRKARLSGSLGR